MYASLKSISAKSFAYTPPESIYGTVRVLVTTQNVRPPVLAAVLRGLWRFSPHTRVLLEETEALEEWMLGANMVVVDLESVPKRPFPSRLEGETGHVYASHLLTDVAGCISVASISADDPPAVPPSLDVVQQITLKSKSPAHAFACVGPFFAGAVVDVGEKVIWGDDLIAVDQAAYRAIDAPVPPALAKLAGAEFRVDEVE